MQTEVLLGNGVGAGPQVWFDNPVEFQHIHVADDAHYYANLFQPHYGKHKNAILPASYLKEIMSMSVQQWLENMGAGLVVFPSRYYGINERIVNFFKDEHCIVWLGYDRKILRQISKIAGELCNECYPDEDTAKFLRLIKSNYTKKYGGTPWVKIID